MQEAIGPAAQQPPSAALTHWLRSRYPLHLRRQIANLLTVLRLALAAPLLALLLVRPEGWRAEAAVLFAVAALTDLLDGYVARHWGTVTSLGRFLDPLADKAVVDGAVIALLLRGEFPAVLAAILLVRDSVITGMRLRQGDETLAPRRMAKAKTFCLYLGVGGLLLGPWIGDALIWTAWGLAGAGTLLSLVSLAGYARRSRAAAAAPAMLGYLLLPRPGPLLSAGKAGFFLLGSFVAVTTGLASLSLGRWLPVLLLYELCVSQGKYLINDAFGRDSDAYFLRGRRNRCPHGRLGLGLLLAFAVARMGMGVAGLLLFAGRGAAAAGLLSVGLQLLYELVKLSGWQQRGGWIFGLVSANYGVRALAGMAAAGAGILSSAGGLVFLWAVALGALFLSMYWQRQAAYYLSQRQLSPALLARYKPGLLALYRRRLHAAHNGKPPEAALLQALALGALPFFLLGPWRGGALFAVSVLAYAAVALAGLQAMRGHTQPVGRLFVPAALAALTIAATAAAGLVLHAPSLLPATLLAAALFTYLIVSNPALEPLVLHGSRDRDPAAA